jgi:heme oxygenase
VTAALERLKTATQAEHRLLEAELNLFRQPYHWADYQNLLEFFYGFHRSFEAYLDAHLSDCPVGHFYSSSRRKAWRAHRDLLWLGVSPAALAAMPLWPTPESWLREPSQVWGALYVVEGSALGAQVIAKHLQGSMPGFDAAGLQFFCGHGSDTSRQWQQFVAHLQQLELLPAELDQAVSSACHVFVSLRAWHHSRLTLAAPLAPR